MGNVKNYWDHFEYVVVYNFEFKAKYVKQRSLLLAVRQITLLTLVESCFQIHLSDAKVKDTVGLISRI